MTAGRRVAVSALAALLAPLALVVAGGARGSADQGDITRLSEVVPNYMDPSYGYQTSPGPSTTMYADPASGLLFQTSVGGIAAHCSGALIQPLLALDIDTYRIVAKGCGGTRPAGGQGSGTKDALVGVDSADHMLFFSDQANDASATVSSSTGVDKVVGVDERTLKVVSTWSLPKGAYPTIYGLSWFAPEDQLIVYTANSLVDTSPSPPGVNVAALDIRASLKARTGVAAWSVQPPAYQCSYPFVPSITTANAYRSQDLPAVFLPCEQGTSRSVASAPRLAILRLELSSTGCAAGVDLCPDGTEVSTPVPGDTEEFMFDPGSDRGFLPSQDNSGTNILVYDGAHDSFIGRMAVVIAPPGQNNTDQNDSVFGLSEQTGRYYTVGGGGFFFSDGRRTPLAPGTTIGSLAGDVDIQSLPVVPPTSRHPFTRFFVEYCKPGTSQATNGCADIGFAVIADNIDVTQDPPPSQVDANTYSGPIPRGADVATSYAGTGRGYGFHVDLVGGLAGVFNNTTEGQPQPWGDKPLFPNNRDLIGGLVSRVTAQSGGAEASATAMGDPNDTVGPDLARCSDLQTVQPCLNPASPPDSSKPKTAQQWPFDEPTCVRPGASDTDLQQSSAGFSTTTWAKDASGNEQPTQQAVPGSAALASAHVDCNLPGGAASGGAALSLADVDQATGAGTAVPGAPNLSVGESGSSVTVTPPADAASGVVGTVTASVRGVSIDLPGNASLHIGEIQQVVTATAAGRPGTASTTRDVQIANVEVVANGQSTVVCQGPCTQGVGTVISTINSLLPSVLTVLSPDPDAFYAKGSPGGYIAAVESDTRQQYGDEQFNGYSAGEASFVPGLRVVVYYDTGPLGPYQLSRVIYDFAGAEIDTEQGINVLLPPPPFTTGLIDVNQAMTDAGVPTEGNGFDAVGSSTPPGSSPVTPAPAYAPGLLGVVQRSLAGIAWFARSPRAALQMFAFLALLGLPLVLIGRRRLWLGDHTGDAG